MNKSDKIGTNQIARFVQSVLGRTPVAACVALARAVTIRVANSDPNKLRSPATN